MVRVQVFNEQGELVGLAARIEPPRAVGDQLVSVEDAALHGREDHAVAERPEHGLGEHSRRQLQRSGARR